MFITPVSIGPIISNLPKWCAQVWRRFV